MLRIVDTVAKAHDGNLHIISATVQYHLATARVKATLGRRVRRSCAYRFFDERNESISLGL